MSKIFAIFEIELKRMIRNQMIWFICFISIVLLFLMDLFNYFTIEEQLKMIKDFSLGLMNLTSLFLVIFYPIHLLRDEFEHKTIYSLLSAPVSRKYILIGKGIAIAFLIFLNLILNSFSLFIMLKIKGGGFNIDLLGGVYMIFLKNIILVGFGFIFVLLPISPILCSVLTFFIYCIGSIKSYFINMLNSEISFIIKIIHKFIMIFVPNLRIYDVVETITLGKHITLNHVIYSSIHFTGISLLVFGIAFILFEFREI